MHYCASHRQQLGNGVIDMPRFRFHGCSRSEQSKPAHLIKAVLTVTESAEVSLVRRKRMGAISGWDPSSEVTGQSIAINRWVQVF